MKMLYEVKVIYKDESFYWCSYSSLSTADYNARAIFGMNPSAVKAVEVFESGWVRCSYRR